MTHIHNAWGGGAVNLCSITHMQKLVFKHHLIRSHKRFNDEVKAFLHLLIRINPMQMAQLIKADYVWFYSQTQVCSFISPEGAS